MQRRCEPESEAQLAEIVADAFAQGTRLEVIGTGTLRGLGRSVACDALLSTAALGGIVDYQPEELMVTVRPGIRMDELTATLAERGQHLAFEPPNLSGLWGGEGGGTIGGIIGANLSGPRRFRAGAARDHVLAVRAVGGRGEIFKAGGKVVKNVTGYDLPKLLTGAFGTLAVLTELTLKVLPRPAFAVSVLMPCSEVADALALLRQLAGDPREPTGLALIVGAGPPCMAVRVEGSMASARARGSALAAMLPGSRCIEADESVAYWAAVRDVHPHLGPDAAAPLWRISLPPSEAENILRTARPRSAVVDHAGGTLWLDQPTSAWAPDPRCMGALLVRGPAALRQSSPTVSLTSTVDALAERIRAQFDPGRILNPGRLAAVPA